MKIQQKLTAACVVALFYFLSSCAKKDIVDLPATNVKATNVHIVSESAAREIAENFNPELFLRNTKRNASPRIGNQVNRKVDEQFSTGQRNVVGKITKFDDRDGMPAFYVCNFVDKKGFVIVSGDQSLSPILAYIPEGNFDEAKIIEPVRMWMRKTTQDVEVARRGLVDTRGSIRAWNAYVAKMSPDQTAVSKGNHVNGLPPEGEDPCADPNATYNNTTYVGPFLTTQWGQLDGYNDLLPFMSCSSSVNGRPPTGWIATAIAQLVRYWQWPTNAYNYSNMPNYYGNSDVQTLMVDAGTSISSGYGCSGSGPTSVPISYVALVEGALKGGTFNFGHATNSSYNMSTDYWTIRSNLSLGMPVVLFGATSTASPYLWLCDGSMEDQYLYCVDGNLTGPTNMYFHMNWGVSDINVGYNNGWYSYFNWSIAGSSYNYYTGLVYNIYP